MAPALHWRLRSSVAQWQSIRLLTEGLLVRVQPGEPLSNFEAAKLGRFFRATGSRTGSNLLRAIMPLRAATTIQQ